MAGNITQKQASATTVQTSGGSLTTGNAVACATANFDNSSTLAFSATATLVGGFGVAPVAGVALELYLVPAADGTNFDDADVSTPFISPTYYVGNFVVTKAQTANQQMSVRGIPLEARLYKVYLWNKSAQTLSSGWTLAIYPDIEQYT